MKIWQLVSVLALAAASPAASQDAATLSRPTSPGGAAASAQQAQEFQFYRVEMTTSMVIPDGKTVSDVSVWHALPVKRAWSNTSTEVGADQIKFTSDFGKQEHRQDHSSHHILWKRNEKLASGTALSFTSSYVVRSAARTFDPASVQTRWPTSFQPPADVEPQLARAADEVRARLDPAHAVVEFSKMIRTGIRYDASVPYKPKEVAETVANRRGHCGHMFWVFEQLCRRVGIPARVVRGLNLANPDGKGRLSGLHPGWTNIHTWAEVYFPEVGWVEAEPSYGARVFSIPARFVQNNKWFQNYAVWVTEDGKRKMPQWTMEGGVYSSDYKTENLITFSAWPDAN